MTTLVRFARFNVVGLLGIGVQLATVAVLAHGLDVDPVLATAAGVSAAVLHNFAWHVRWTWRDRMAPGVSRIGAFGRFVGANGLVSLVGSVMLVPALLGIVRLPVMAANVAAIALCGLLNYGLGDRVVYPAAKSLPRG
jgi:putative flippase GtrA